MMDYQFKDILLESEINAVKLLLKKNNLTYESNVTKTIGLYDKQKLVATGSIDHYVIKMIAVDQEYQSRNLSAKVISHLLFDLEAHHIDHYFLFTKPEHFKIFNSFSFNKIIETKDIVLFENKEQDIKQNLMKMAKKLPKKKGDRACIVMNLNPITLGHLHLIEHAASKHADLIIFLVETNASIINYQTRYQLLKKSTSHLKNITICPSSNYMISRATFPTYFLKDKNQIDIYTHLDISIFKTYFMPIFEIDMRYVGDEPLDKLTMKYNQAMQAILKDKVTVIKRITFQNEVISASHVRELAQHKDYESIKKIVPKATYKYLTSKKGRKLFSE